MTTSKKIEEMTISKAMKKEQLDKVSGGQGACYDHVVPFPGQSVEPKACARIPWK